MPRVHSVPRAASVGRALFFLCCWCSTFLLVGCFSKSYPPEYREFAYVANGKSNSVTVIDTRALRAVATISVGAGPTGVSVNARRNEVYVVNSDSNNVSVIDAEQNRVVSTIGVHRAPYFLDVSADGTRGYAANAGSNNVSVLDLAARKVIANVRVGVAPGLARVSPDDKSVVVSNRGDDSVSVIDASTLTVRGTIAQVCQQPTDIAIMWDSSKAFVACSGSAQVAVIALKSKENPQDRLLVLLDVGKSPVQLGLKPDGGEIYTANFEDDSVSEIATTNNEVGGSYPIGRQPVRVLFSADNSVVYVSNFGSDTVAVYSVADGKLIGAAHVGGHPDGLALSPNQNFLYVVDTGTGDVAVIRTQPIENNPPLRGQALPMLTMIPVGEKPNGIAIKGFMARREK